MCNIILRIKMYAEGFLKFLKVLHRFLMRVLTLKCLKVLATARALIYARTHPHTQYECRFITSATRGG